MTRHSSGASTSAINAYPRVFSPGYPGPNLILPMNRFVYYVGAMFTARVTDSFSAAHSLREYGGSCERLHGHNYKVEVAVQSDQLNSIGIVMDFRDLKNLLKEALFEMDHRHLNELPAFAETNPSAENIARHVFNSLSEKIPSPVKLAQVTVWENEFCCVSFSGPG